MNSAMRITFLSCQKSTELVERKIYFGKLSQMEKLRLTLHHMICKYCARYERQSLLIEKELVANSNKNYTDEALAELKQNIIRSLKL